MGIVIPDEEIIADKDFEVLDENWEVFNLFVRLQTQWNISAGIGGVIYHGLKYEVVFQFFDLYSVGDRAEAFESLQVMELAALPELNKAKDG